MKRLPSALTSLLERPMSYWAAFLVTRVTIWILVPLLHGDLTLYRDYFEHHLAHEIVYQDFQCVYPPLAYAFAVFPAYLGATVETYPVYFRAECSLLDILIFCIIRHDRQSTVRRLYTYIFATFFLGHLLYNRLDIGLACLLAVAISSLDTQRWQLGYLALGAGCAFKIVPLLMLPGLLAWEIRRRPGRIVLAVCYFGVAALLPVLPSLLNSKLRVFSALAGHSERGIEIESTWASLEMLLRLFGVHAEVYWAYGCHNLRTPIEPYLRVLSHWLIVGVAILACPVNNGVGSRSTTPRTGLAAVLASILLSSKVFSPQYLLFLLPVMLLSPRLPAYRQPLILLVCLFTAWIYPYHYDNLLALETTSLVMVCLRNLLFACLVLDLVLDWVRPDREAIWKSTEHGRNNSVVACN